MLAALAQPRRRLAVSSLVVALTLVGAACLPLPTEIEHAMCPAGGPHVPAQDAIAPLVPFPADLSPGWQRPVPAPNAAILDRLATFPGEFTVSTSPVVTVRVTGAGAAADETAAALRREFGNTIDIEAGFKRLGGGPGGGSTCLLLAPRWAIGERIPKGLRVTVTPNRTVFDRGETVTADVTVTNRTGRTIGIGPLNGRSGRGCDAPYIHQPISSIDSALAVNVSVGPAPRDVLDPERPLAGREFDRTAPGSATTWRTMMFTCEGTGSHAAPLAAGASVTFMIRALPTSLRPGDEADLGAGHYDLRPLLVFDPAPPGIGVGRTTSAALPIPPALRVVAAPPTRIEIGG